MNYSIRKKIVSIALLGATTSSMAILAEHASLYKDPRMMGMGGANIAVGAYSTSVFTNPAGLASIKKDDGFVVDLLGITGSMSPDVINFVDDLSDVETDSDINPSATDDLLNVLKEYSGTPFHIGVDNYTSISKNSDAFAWSIGILAASDFNYMAHPNGGTQGLVTTTSRAYGGLVLGAAKPYETEFGRLDVGLSLKYIVQKSYEGGLSITDLLADDVSTVIRDKFEKDGTGIGADLGVTYHPFVDNYWHPAIGMSIMNIGSMSMDDQFGGQPMTVNIGASITPEFPIFDKFVLAIDYVDLMNANTIREYNIDDNSFTDYEEDDFAKRLRVGVGMGLIDNSWLHLTLKTGLYQGAYTAGLDLALALLKVNVATYQENVGTSATPIEDRRYMAQIGIGW